MTRPYLANLRRKGLRNGQWKQLSIAEHALFQCAMWVARARGKIRNIRLNAEVLRICVKLLKGAGSDILRAGSNRALMMCQAFDKTRVLEWAPQVGEWLQDTKYVWYLGILAANP